MHKNAEFRKRRENAQARYMLGQLKGFDVIEICPDDELTEYFGEKYKQYINLWYNGMSASDKISLDTDEHEL